MTLANIWPKDVKIDVIGLTGPIWSGKTLFGLLIDPEHTLYDDFEKSGSAYEGIGVERNDVPSILLEEYPKGYNSKQVFEWWLKRVRAIPPGKYSVYMADPFSDIEDGLVEWVKSRYAEWGFSSAAKFAALEGIFWNRVKSELKKILVDLSSRVQTFVFTSHLKQVWRNGKPTDKLIPKGKKTLMELATLYVYLERSADKEGNVPEIPSGVIIKARLSNILKKDGKILIQSMLPPRLPRATPDDIRQYILNPPDYSKLKVDEKVPERILSNDERLELEKETAEAQQAAAEAVLESDKLKDKQEANKAVARSRLRPNPDKAVETQKDQQEAAEGQNTKNTEEEPLTLEVTEEESDALLTQAEGLGIKDRVITGIKKALTARQVEYDTDLVTPRLLTKVEYENFKAGLDKLASKA